MMPPQIGNACPVPSDTGYRPEVVAGGPEGHDGVPGLKSYLGSRAVRPNLIARDSSRLIFVQVSLSMIAFSEPSSD